MTSAIAEIKKIDSPNQPHGEIESKKEEVFFKEVGFELAVISDIHIMRIAQYTLLLLQQGAWINDKNRKGDPPYIPVGLEQSVAKTLRTMFPELPLEWVSDDAILALQAVDIAAIVDQLLAFPSLKEWWGDLSNAKDSIEEERVERVESDPHAVEKAVLKNEIAAAQKKLESL